jgi:hypothetical protein
MPTAWETFPIKFEGGLITNMSRLDQGLQAPGSATLLQNFENSIEGGYKKILGYSKFSSTEVTGTGQVMGVIVAAEGKAIATRNGKYYTSSGTTWTERATASSTGFTRIRHDKFNFDGTEKIVIVDGLNDPLFYSSADDSMTYDTSAPSDVTGSSHVVVFKNQVFFGKGNLLTFTAPYDPLSYEPGDGAGIINVGSVITGLVIFREQLIIFSIDRIQRLTGNTQADFKLQPITLNTGCLNADSIQEIGGDILYMGPDGIRFLSATEKNEDFALDLASEKIQKLMREFISMGTTYSSLVIRSKSQYRLFSFSPSLSREVSFGYTATKFSDQSVENIAWSKLVGIKVYDSDSKQYDDTEVILFVSDLGYVYRMETGGSFDGVPIPAIFETPYMPITDPRVRKTIYKHSLYTTIGGNFDLQISIRLDYRNPGVIQPPSIYLNSVNVVGAVYGSPFSVYGSVVSYGGNEQNTYVNQVVGSGFTIALRYEDTSTNPSFSMGYAILEYTNNERR